MWNRKMWKRISAVMMCSALMLSTPAVYAADTQPGVQAEETKDTKEVKGKEEVKGGEEVTPAEGAEKADKQNKAEAEKPTEKSTETSADTKESDITNLQQGTLPSVTTKEVTFEGKDIELVVSLGDYTENIYQSVDVKINDVVTATGYFQNEKSTIKIGSGWFDKIPAGKYPIEVTFKDSNNQILNVDKNCQITIAEANKPKVTPATIEFDGTNDIVLSFDKGTNYYELRNISNVGLMSEEEGVKGFGSEKAGEDFTYDLNKGELVIKKEFVNSNKPKKTKYTVYAIGWMANEGVCELSTLDNPSWLVNYVGDANQTPDTDNNDFVIENGVLIKYTGTASEVTIPEGVTSIGQSAFVGNINITRVTFPSSLTSIGNYAFADCRNLVVFTIPSNVVYIGKGAFMAEGSPSQEKLTINGNNTTIEGGAFAFRKIKEIVLNGDFVSIEDSAFDAQSDGGRIASFTVNGVIEKLGNIFPMTPVEKFIVNGDIKHIEGGYNDNIFTTFETVDNVTIYGKEGSYIQQYAKERNLPFEVIDGTPEEPSAPQHIVDLTKGSTSVPKSDMQDLVNLNQTQDIVIKSTDGVVFTFPKGSMKMIDGKENYDFGVEVITDFSKVTNTPFNKDTFAFQINYNYDGELPGTAKISIPVDKKWANQTLYYYRILGEGEFKYLTNAVVDANGIYTISMNHCSDYVATTQEADKNGNPTKPTVKPTDSTKPTDTTNKTTPTNPTSGKTSPKTGDNTPVIFYLIIALLSACGIGVVSVRRKIKIK